jgi:hypothetical protein
MLTTRGEATERADRVILVCCTKVCLFYQVDEWIGK